MLQSKHSIERHPFFPYIAWFLVLIFSLFVYTIVQDLRNTTRDLEQVATRLELQANTPPEEITDFNR